MDESDFHKPHIMVVDDDEGIREVFSDTLKVGGYKCSTAVDAEQALSILEDADIEVVLTDIVMPGMSGLDFITKVREISDCDVIAFTGHVKDYSYMEAIRKGANDFMVKPIDQDELLARLKRVLRERTLIRERDTACKNLEATNQQLLKYGQDLNRNFQQLKDAHVNLQQAYLETIHRLVIAAEYKDEDTAIHIVRMSRYCALLAEKLGLSRTERESILYASPMHDVGKIGIPDSILMKPGRLTEEECAVMKTHTDIGGKILANSDAEVIKKGAEIALSHHEKWNGEGYPLGLSGKKIPLCGRIAAVADVFDALTSQRPYKKALPLEKSLDIMKEGRGTHFDPQILDVFIEQMEDIMKIKGEVDEDKKTRTR